MNLESLSDFVLVATHGGVTQAARASNRPKASLSRRVMELEAALGVRLFERGSRSVRLTEEGELLLARTAAPLSDIAEAGELLRDGRALPRGRLRINVPAVFGQVLLGRLAAGFADAYPEVRLDATMEDRAVDLVAEGYDVVVRLNPKSDSALVGRCFVRDRLVIVAAPSLAMPAGATSDPLPVVVRTALPSEKMWRVPGPDGPAVSVRTVLELPALPTVRDAVLTGIGAARLPRVLVADDLASGRLVSWGPASGRASELWALHASSRLPSAKVKAFLRFLDEAFPAGWL